MPSPDALAGFVLATLVLLVIPGPAVMYIVTRSATQGRRAGLVSVLGIHAGTVVHLIAAMVGLSAILAASATAFSVVRLLGAGYLLWLGIQALRSYRAGSGGAAEIPVPQQRSMRRVFTDGFILNILNPKTAIFFLLFLPQFVDYSAPHPTAAIAVLGGIFIGLGLVSDGAYAIGGGWIGGRLRSSPELRRRKELFAGGTYLGLGAITAFGGAHSA